MSQPGGDDPLARLTPYERRHLGSHLAAAGDAEGLGWLLALEWSVELPPTPEPESKRRWWQRRRKEEEPQARLGYRNAWYEAKERIGDAAGYREDVESAWRLASEACATAIAAGTRPPLAEELRCALLVASVHSLGEGLATPMLRALVERGVWSEAHALVYAEQPGEERVTRMLALLPVLSAAARAEAIPRLLELATSDPRESSNLCALAEFLDQPQLGRVFAAVREDGEGWATEDVCAAVVERLVALGAVEPALAIAREPVFDEGWKAAAALGRLAARLEEPQLRELLAAVRAWKTPTTQQEALAGLYARLAALGHVEEALEGAAEIEPPGQRGKVVTWMAPALDRAGRERALAFAPEAPHGELRAKALLALATAAARDGDEESKATFADEAVRALESVDEMWVVETLVSVAPAIAALRPEAALGIAKGIGDRSERIVALAALVPHISGANRARALELARQSAEKGDELSPDGLGALSELDPERAFEIAAEQTRRATDPKVLADIAPHVRGDALLELHRRLAALGDDRERETARARLDAELAVYGDAGALERLAVFEPANLRAEVFATVAPRLPEALLPRAGELLLELTGHDLKAAIPAFAPRMNEEQRRILLDEVGSRDYDWAYAAVVQACAGDLAPPLLAHALDLGLSRRNKAWRAWSFAALVPRLELPQLERGLELTAKLGEDHQFQVEAIDSAVAVRLAQLGRTGEGLARAARIVGEGRWQCEAVCGVAPHLEGAETRAEAERLAARIGQPSLRAEAFAALSAAATEPERTRLEGLALAEAQRAAVDDPRDPHDPDWRQQGNPAALARLVYYLGDPALEQAVAAGEAAPESERPKAIEALGPLAGERLAAAARLARGIEDTRSRSEAFVALLAAAPEPPAELVVEAVRAAYAEDSIDRGEHLSTAVLRLIELDRPFVQDIWSAVLPRLVERGRGELAADIGAMAPALGALGGPEALRDSVAAIDDVVRWWP